MFFGREADFDLVRKRFTDTKAKGGLLVFCGERRSGKTSILFQILDGRLGPEFLPVLIDMQSMAIESELDFLSKIAEEIVTRLEWEGHPVDSGELISGSNPAAAFHKFVGKILKVNPSRKLILLFDEYELFENKIDTGALTEDTLFILSNLMENHSVFLIFTGSLSLDRRRHDYWKIFLGKSIYRQISYLEHADATRLITEPVAGRVSYEPDVVEAIYRLTAGQPFYTQAVCQNLVDHLNEDRINTATSHMVDDVVTGIVQNPFPQMIFLWEGLEDREKLVMALLAEVLSDDKDRAEPKHLVEKISTAKYPLDLDNAAISTSLEKLFKQEILLKTEASAAAYAFRMDLWRLWVRRMHSVWQVMREIGMSIRPARRSQVPMLIGVVVTVAALAVVAFIVLQRQGPPAASTGVLTTQAAFLEIDVIPDKAVIYRNGTSVGLGSYGSPTPTGSHDIRLAAAGYAESTFTVVLTPEDTSRWAIELEPQRGNIVIRTDPPGAEISVDGVRRGRSPLTLTGLAVPARYSATAEMEGYLDRTETFSVLPDTTVPFDIVPLEPIRASVTVTTTPPGATVTVDGRGRGRSPLSALTVSPGTHRFHLGLSGFVAVDTTLEVGEGGGRLHVPLRTEPPGFLEIRGDSIAVIMVDGRVIKSNTYNSRPQQMAVGWHGIRVRLRAGTEIVDSVLVNSKEQVVYDYSEQRVTSRTQ
jgi:hypothetical protein